MILKHNAITPEFDVLPSPLVSIDQQNLSQEKTRLY